MPLTQPAPGAELDIDSPSAKRMRRLLVLLGILGLLLPVLLVWSALPQVLYAGLDGSLYQFTIDAFFRHAPPFSLNAMNIFQGLGSPLIPMNVWLNPGYLVFSVFDQDTARLVSSAIFLGAYCLATFLLARTIGFSLVPAVIAAQLAVIAFPPFQYETGLGNQFILNPGVAYTLALITFLLCVVLRILSFSFAKVIAYGFGIAALYGYSVYCDPFWTPVITIAFGIPFLFFVCADAPPSALLARLASMAIAASILYVIGTFDYVYSLVSYTARQVFQQEVHGEVQIGQFVSILFQSRTAFLTYWLWFSGWILAVVFATARQRLLAFVCIAHVLALMALGAVFLFVDINWSFPVPMYFEQSAYHFFTLAAVVGWVALLKYYDGLALRVAIIARLRNAVFRSSTLFGFVGVLLVPAAIIYYLIAWVPLRQGIYQEKPVPDIGFMQDIRDEVRLDGNVPFRGSVTLPVLPTRIVEGLHEKFVALTPYSTQRIWHTLWKNGVPTLESYGQTVPPPFYYFMSRLLIGSGDPMGRNGVYVSEVNVPMLQALGVRFVVYPLKIANLEATLRKTYTAEDGGIWFLYELKNPNVGNYTPSKVRVATTARKSIEILRSGDFDFANDALLTEKLALPLSEARNAGFSFRDGAIHVWAESDGHSLVVLPVVFSRCLTFTRPEQAQIKRVDLTLTGISFHGKLNATIRSDFSILSRRCRREDLQDLNLLRFEAEASRVSPVQHPHAFIRLKDLKRELYEVLGEMP